MEIREEAIIHSKIFKEKYLGKIKPTFDLEKMMRDKKPQVGTYDTPSTEEE